MNTQTANALKMAIDVLQNYAQADSPVWRKALNACKEALKPHPDCDEACMYQCEHERKHKALEAEQVCQAQKPVLITRIACPESNIKQPAQEPEFDLKDLACSAHEEAMSFGLDRNLFERYFKKIANLYTHPHQWQGLTDDEIKEFMGNCWESPYHLIKVIEQALKEKNHG